jgi:hypothetical protein
MSAGSHWASLKPDRLQSGVVLFAVVFVVGANGAAGAELPGFVGDHAGPAAVFVLDVEFEDGFRKAEIARAGLQPGCVVAAVAEHQSDGVAAPRELAGHVEGHVEHALVVVGEAG